MILKGTVRNIVDFGAFVDIGVHQDGLVHISRITKRFIKHPLEAVSVGDIVDVKVLEVDLNKKRIALTMRLDEEELGVTVMTIRPDEKTGLTVLHPKLCGVKQFQKITADILCFFFNRMNLWGNCVPRKKAPCTG